MTRLNWNYCECGCHGHELSVGSLHLWLFNNLEGRFDLHQGHGWTSPRIASFDSMEAADARALEMVQAEVGRVQAALERVQVAVTEAVREQPVTVPNRFHRPDPVDIEHMGSEVPPSTACKHGKIDCKACGTSNRRDVLHTTAGGKGAVGMLREKTAHPLRRKRA